MSLGFPDLWSMFKKNDAHFVTYHGHDFVDAYQIWQNEYSANNIHFYDQ